MIRNFAVVGPGRATRETLTTALAAAPDMAVYRIGRGADPLPVSASFDPADQPGCRSLLDWFERGAPSGAVLLVDDWELCADLDPELATTIEWIAAFGPPRGVQVVVTARKWGALPDQLRRQLHGEATDFLALHGIEADLTGIHQRDDLLAAIGSDARGWPVYLDITTCGSCVGPAAQREQLLLAALLGLMATHSSVHLNLALFDLKNIGVFDGLDAAPHVAFALTGEDDAALFERFRDGLAGEVARRREHTGEPLPALLVCIDSAEVLLERFPGYQDVLEQLTAGRALGVHVLFSGDTFPVSHPPAWPSAIPPHDLEEWADVLPGSLAGTSPPAHVPVPPPLPQDLTLDVLPPGGIGLLDVPLEQRRDVLFHGFTAELRHGAIVGKPGTGKTTTLRTLAAVLGDDLGRFQLLDGPGEPLDLQRHIIVTAYTWEQVPPFIRENLAFGIEFRLDDPGGSIVDVDEAGKVPDRPGFGLSVPHRLHARIARP
ncbi:hypothetical protein [Lentzea sp. NBRC 102530]|uniref:hypothetical protein n=1 Tax=Lentzea sp. NBRC 102530 TaxID=3032201 RepID=UPI0024A12833|nr:hypothetical protein [Lentzea sp. NBRC 102530]GLY48542.1 hypothetical protein Lesp01_21980 [Lentzea sp. NBRC 102530]